MNSDGISLAGVDISKAHLLELKLENADLREANFAGAKLINANLTGALLSGANLTGTNLGDSGGRMVLGSTNFRLASLSDDDHIQLILDANFAGAYGLDYADNIFIVGTNLADIKQWQEVSSIKDANIRGVRNPPEGFVQWAVDHGAVSIEDEEWKNLMREQKKQEAGNSTEDQKEVR